MKRTTTGSHQKKIRIKSVNPTFATEVSLPSVSFIMGKKCQFFKIQTHGVLFRPFMDELKLLFVCWQM